MNCGGWPGAAQAGAPEPSNFLSNGWVIPGLKTGFICSQQTVVVLISVNHKLIMARRQYLNFTILICCLLVPIFAQDCTVDQYKCEFGGKCIENDQICDGTEDCEDNLEDEFTCTVNGVPKCLGPRKYCDGIQDCDNNEDEDSQDCCENRKLKFYNPSLVNFYVCLE